MGADSAISYNSYITEPSGRKRKRILTGGTKTLWIPKINAGISYWGEGNIGDVTTDVWLSDFIFSHEDQYDSISDFAILLQDELRPFVPEISEPEGSVEYRFGKRGFHLGGFIEHEGKPLPTFYHIHNGQSETTSNINPRIINANYDLPPERVLYHFAKSESPYVRNGEFFLYTALFQNLRIAFRQFEDLLRKATGSPFIFPDLTKFSDPLEAYSEFVRFWIRLVRDVFALSNLPEIIGGDISVLSISPTGEMKFSRRP
jgi:hypothetical protein